MANRRAAAARRGASTTPEEAPGGTVPETVRVYLLGGFRVRVGERAVGSGGAGASRRRLYLSLGFEPVANRSVFRLDAASRTLVRGREGSMRRTDGGYRGFRWGICRSCAAWTAGPAGRKGLP
jgi:hypothetical protein